MKLEHIHGSYYFKDQQMVKFDKITKIVIIHQNTSWFRVF
jgi:hypothetical protein